MRLSLDTNVYVGLMRGHDAIARTVAEAEKILIPLPVLAELRAGFEYGGFRPDDNENTLQLFLGGPRADIVFPDNETTYLYARLYDYLRKKGRPIPTNDIWIAALAIEANSILFTMDAHFEGLPKLAVLRPET